MFIQPEDEQAALRALRSHLYFRYDYRDYAETECGQFEQELCDYFGSKHALAVASGTAALALAIMAAGIPPGSLIACPGFTFVATPSAIVLAGCVPFLVEVDENLHLDLADLRHRWNPDIKAIMVVHMRGFASDLDALTEFAAEMGVPLFEDAVPALGAELNGRKLGTFGLAGGFSTQSDKSLNSGEGGFLLTDDSDLYARAVVLAGAYEGRCARHFGDGSDAAGHRPHAAAAEPADGRDPGRAAALGTASGCRPGWPPSTATTTTSPPRWPTWPASRSGSRWRPGPTSARRSSSGCRTARPAGSPTRCAPRASTPATSARPATPTSGRSGTGGSCSAPPASPRSRQRLPATTGYLCDAVDVALSSTLSSRGLRPPDHRGPPDRPAMPAGTSADAGRLDSSRP